MTFPYFYERTARENEGEKRKPSLGEIDRRSASFPMFLSRDGGSMFCVDLAATCSHDDVIDLVDYLLVTLSMIDLEVSKCEIILDVDRFYGD